MPGHRGFHVYVASEGSTLKEHELELKTRGGTPTLTCYIASECGKEFGVYWREPAMRTEMLVRVSMDGQLTDEVAHFEYEGTGESKGVIDYDLRAFRPYRFENIKTTDDERLAHPGRVSSKLGTITVEFFKVVWWDECKARPRFDSKSVMKPRYAHEVDNMGDHHAVGFGSRRTMRAYPYSYQVYKPVGEEKRPFLIFNFKYRPQTVLQILGIVPLAPPQTSARKRLRSPSLITNASKRSREDSEGLTEVPDSDNESSSSEDSRLSLEPESEEGVVRDTSIVDQTGGDEADCQKPTLAACEAAKLAAIEAQIEKLNKEKAKMLASLQPQS